MPASGQLDDYQAPSIARAVYEHLLRWTSSTPGGAASQVLLVDTDPPGLGQDVLLTAIIG